MWKCSCNRLSRNTKCVICGDTASASTVDEGESADARGNYDNDNDHKGGGTSRVDCPRSTRLDDAGIIYQYASSANAATAAATASPESTPETASSKAGPPATEVGSPSPSPNTQCPAMGGDGGGRDGETTRAARFYQLAASTDPPAVAAAPAAPAAPATQATTDTIVPLQVDHSSGVVVVSSVDESEGSTIHSAAGGSLSNRSSSSRGDSRWRGSIRSSNSSSRGAVRGVSIGGLQEEVIEVTLVQQAVQDHRTDGYDGGRVVGATVAVPGTGVKRDGVHVVDAPAASFAAGAADAAAATTSAGGAVTVAPFAANRRRVRVQRRGGGRGPRRPRWKTRLTNTAVVFTGGMMIFWMIFPRCVRLVKLFRLNNGRLRI